MKRYIKSSEEYGYFSSRTQADLEELVSQGKFDNLADLIKSDPVCAPIVPIYTDKYTLNYRDYNTHEVADAVSQMYKLIDSYIAENLEVSKSVTDDREIFDEAVYARIAKVLDNLDKYQSKVDRIADSTIQYYRDEDEAWFEDVSKDIYTQLREFVSKIAGVDYLNYYLGDDNYDRLYEISGDLAKKFADKYGVELLYEDL